MKKMIMMIAALIVAVGVQAASIDWSITANSMKFDDGTKLSSGVSIYLIDKGEIDGITAALDSGTFGDTTKGVLEITTTVSKGSVKSHRTTSDQLIAGNGPDGNRMKYDYAYVFQDKDNLDKYFISGSLNNGAYLPGDPDFGETLKLSFGTTAFNEGNWHVVPEPTSVALLALGLAAFGLRRKFRA